MGRRNDRCKSDIRLAVAGTAAHDPFSGRRHGGPCFSPGRRAIRPLKVIIWRSKDRSSSELSLMMEHSSRRLWIVVFGIVPKSHPERSEGSGKPRRFFASLRMTWPSLRRFLLFTLFAVAMAPPAAHSSTRPRQTRAWACSDAGAASGRGVVSVRGPVYGPRGRRAGHSCSSPPRSSPVGTSTRSPSRPAGRWRPGFRSDPPPGVRIVGRIPGVGRPREEAGADAFDNLPVESHHGTVTWYAPIELAPGVDPAELRIDGKLTVQPCDANSCLPPHADIVLGGLGPGSLCPTRPQRRARRKSSRRSMLARCWCSLRWRFWAD